MGAGLPTRVLFLAESSPLLPRPQP